MALPRISFSTAPDVARALDARAKADRRSVSFVVANIVAEELATTGFLQARKEKTVAARRKAALVTRS